MINYNQFIKESTEQVKERLAHFNDEKKLGKIYQDRIVQQFQGSEISLSKRATLNEKKKQEIISDILKDIPLIDEELYEKLVDRRKEYRSKYHPGKTLSLEEYITQTIQGMKTHDELILQEKTKELEKSYPSYRERMNEKYKQFNNTIEIYLDNDKNIKQFIKQRIENNYKNRLSQQQELLNILDKEIDKINSLLQTKNIKTKDRKEYENDLEILTAEQNYENDQYQNILEMSQNENHNNHQERKFRKNFVILLHHYICSTQKNADENMRKKYIELFLYDELKDKITFNQQNDYKLVLGEKTNNEIDKQSQEIVQVFNQTKNPKQNSISKDQLTFNFDETILSNNANQQLRLSFGT